MKVYHYIITIYEQKKSHHGVCGITSCHGEADFHHGCVSPEASGAKPEHPKAKTDVAAPFRLAEVLLINPSPFTLANQKLIINSNKLFKVHEKGGKFSLRI